MKIKCIGCEALARPLYACAARSPHLIDVGLFQIGLHDKPADLRRRLQNEIDVLEDSAYDAIVLAYGLCGKATNGINARSKPIVLPRAHDCITLFLGSRSRYTTEFNQNPGTYWYSLDYIERRSADGGALSLGAAGTADVHQLYEEYVVKYGKDNADYLIEVMGAWQTHYNRAVFLDLGVGKSTTVEEQARKDAASRGWTYDHMLGDIRLIRDLLDGNWGDDFLVVSPGAEIRMSGGDGIICAVQSAPEEEG